MTDDEISNLCRVHGAKTLSDAAYDAMNGRRGALDALGLSTLQGLAELNRVTSIAYTLLSDEDQADDLVRAAVDLAKLPPRR